MDKNTPVDPRQLRRRIRVVIRTHGDNGQFYYPDGTIRPDDDDDLETLSDWVGRRLKGAVTWLDGVLFRSTEIKEKNEQIHDQHDQHNQHQGDSKNNDSNDNDNNDNDNDNDNDNNNNDTQHHQHQQDSSSKSNDSSRSRHNTHSDQNPQ